MRSASSAPAPGRVDDAGRVGARHTHAQAVDHELRGEGCQQDPQQTGDHGFHLVPEDPHERRSEHEGGQGYRFAG